MGWPRRPARLYGTGATSFPGSPDPILLAEFLSLRGRDAQELVYGDQAAETAQQYADRHQADGHLPKHGNVVGQGQEGKGRLDLVQGEEAPGDQQADGTQRADQPEED